MSIWTPVDFVRFGLNARFGADCLNCVHSRLCSFSSSGLSLTDDRFRLFNQFSTMIDEVGIAARLEGVANPHQQRREYHDLGCRIVIRFEHEAVL